MIDETPQSRSVVVERVFSHPPEKIWRALTQPALIADWLMKSDFEARIGHRFAFNAEWGSVDCEVLEIEPNRLLTYSWAAHGLDSIVTFILTASAGGTHLRVEQKGFRPDQPHFYSGAADGWPRFIDALDKTLAQAAS